MGVTKLPVTSLHEKPAALTSLHVYPPTLMSFSFTFSIRSPPAEMPEARISSIVAPAALSSAMGVPAFRSSSAPKPW